MTLDELKAEATKLLALKPASGYTHQTFTTRSGGGPRNDVGVPEVHRDSQFKYNTVRHGGAYAGTVSVECRDTGVKDADGRAVYETPTGLVFVYAYSKGSPEYFDGGALVSPRMT